MKGGIRKGENCNKKVTKQDSSGRFCCAHLKKEDTNQKQSKQKQSKNDGKNFLQLNDAEDENEGQEEQEYKQQYNYSQQQQQSEQYEDEGEEDDAVEQLVSVMKELLKEQDISKVKQGLKKCIQFANTL